MNWNAKKSRDLFFVETGEPKVSYWANPRLEAEEGSFRREVPKEFLEWNVFAPEARSNCPILDSSVRYLVKLVDPRWRARAQNIFAGRTFLSDEIAFAKQKQVGGMVAISHQFSTALAIYSLSFGRFVRQLDDLKLESAPNYDTFSLRTRSEVAIAISRYVKGGLQAARGHAIFKVPSHEFEQGSNAWCEAAEDWTIAHELAHHLVRHMSARRDRELDGLIRKLAANDPTELRLERLTREQRDEIDADFLAAVIIGGIFAADEDNTLKRPILATSGAALALVAVGHLRNEWMTGDADSHPGCMLRLRVLLTRLSQTWGSVAPDEPELAHQTVYRLCGLMMTYAHVVSGIPLAAVEDVSIPSDRPDADIMQLFAHYASIFGLLSDAAAEAGHGSD